MSVFQQAGTARGEGAPPRFRIDIQALRGLAVLLVVLQHAAIDPFRAGFLGVDMFFVISGFLITGIIAREMTAHRFSFADFYYRRAKRLLPAAYATVVLTSIGAIVFVNSIEMQSLRSQVLGAVTYTINFVLLRQAGYFDVAAEYKPLLHMWSLAVEEQFYIVFPALLSLTPKAAWRPMIVGLGGLSFLACVLVSHRHAAGAFYLLPTRAWELCMGALGALIADPSGTIRRRCRAAFWPAVAVLTLVPIHPTGLPHPGLDALLVCSATLVIILARVERVAATLPVRALGKMGDLSYSLYLVHWPIIVFIRSSFVDDVPLRARGLGIGLSIAAAIVLYLGVERPFRRGNAGPSRAFALRVAAASLAVVIILECAVAYARPAIDFADIRRPNYGLDRLCDDADFTPKPACRTSDHPTLMVWGDSYAMHLVSGIRKQTEQGIIQATFSACAPFLGYAPQSTSELWSRRCISFNQLVLDYARADKSIRTVVLGGSFALYTDSGHRVLRLNDRSELLESPTGLDMAVAATGKIIEALQASGKTVILVGPAPAAGTDNSVCAERLITRKFLFDAVKDCTIARASFAAGSVSINAYLSRLHTDYGVRVIQLGDALCSDAFCQTIVDGIPIYRDSWHLSYPGSEKVFSILAQKGVSW